MGTILRTDELVAEAKRLRATGLSYHAIASTMGVGYYAVWTWVNGKRPDRRKSPPPPRPCESCGAPIRAHTKKARRCQSCRVDATRYDWTKPRACRKCGVVRDPEEFYKRGTRRYSYCIWCSAAVSEKWEQANPEKRKASQRTGRLARKLGLTTAQFRALGIDFTRCEGCGCSPEENNGRWKVLHADHDHQTGVFRGVLCNGCNRSIGFADDDPARLRALADYLERATMRS